MQNRGFLAMRVISANERKSLLDVKIIATKSLLNTMSKSLVDIYTKSLLGDQRLPNNDFLATISKETLLENRC